ncbi:MAG: acyltransferase family protein [Actinomycetota bacterium]|nr:acyltransferase family protein [Actinomycetota bacterium]
MSETDVTQVAADTAVPRGPQTPWHIDRGRKAGEMGYIPGLDGIRAIAVIGVLLYHADLDFIPGGFLGVDVFFVLSGFLITSLLLEQYQRSGRINFKVFYLGRIRRLFPALIAVLLVVGIVSAFFYKDAAGRSLSDIIASFFYVNNWWYIVGDQSYFDFIARPPLLKHLWSLAIEEQFYFIWPAVAFLIMRKWQRRGVLLFSLLLAFASTAWMFYLSNANGYPELADPTRVYFGADSHAMGLLIGAALAAVWRPGRMQAKVNPLARNLLNLIGVLALAGLLGFYVFVGEFAPWLYRGGFLILAGIVALLIAITSHPASGFCWLLGLQPLRYIGQRSYGLYLWHWPIFAVTRPELDIPLDGLSLLVLRLGLTFGAAELSYRYLEMPIRRGAIGKLKNKWERGTTATRSKLRWQVPGALLVSLLALVTILTALVVTARNTTTAPDIIAAIGDRPAVTIDTTSNVKPSVSAMGDSVMLGARKSLQGAMPGITIDAAVSRFPGAFIGPLKRYEKANKLGSTVIVHPGTNGVLPESMLREMLNILKPHARVVLVNDNMPRTWRNPNNNVIDDVAKDYPNVVLVDWYNASHGHPEYFVSDGVHLTSKGAATYSQLLKNAAEAPAAQPLTSP